MGKIYGKDGSIYNDPMEAVRANARWDQQERQNNLIKEQNELIRKQMNSNNSSSNIPMSDKELESVDKFVDFIIPAFFIITGFIIAKFGLIDAIISGFLGLFSISINYGNQIGLTLFSIGIVIYLFKKFLFRK